MAGTDKSGMEDIFDKAAKNKINSVFDAAIDKAERGIIPSFTRGLKSGVSGIVLGASEQPTPKDTSWYEDLSSMAGELVSDMPAMAVGGEVGAIAGAPLPVIGSIAGGAAGAFAAPTLIKKAVQEYRDFAKKGTDLTFGEFLQAAGRTAKETGKSAIVGAATGKISKLLPILSKMPGMNKLLNSKLGTAAVKGGLELGAMTGTQAGLEGRTPTMKEIFENAAMLTAMKGAHKVTGKVKGVLSRPEGESIVKAATSMLPEKVQKKAAKLGEKAFEKAPEFVKTGVKEVGKLRKNAAQKAYFEMLSDHIGKRNSRYMESQFEWRDKLAVAEKDGKFTKSQLEDMTYYRQKTGNPSKEGDSYKELSKRLPKHAREFVDNVIDKHLKESLKAWNDNPITKDINPREGLEKFYMPGLYEGDPKKFNKVYDEVSKKFKTKNPFSNEKTFLTYMEAFKKGGLKPRYNNIIDIMKSYDKTMAKILSNSELIERFKEIERKDPLSGEGKKLIINSTNKAEYAKAKEAGFVPFDDLFLRGYSSKDRPTAAPALVNPDFASAFQGVFSKDAYKPDHPFLKATDSIRDTIRGARVMLSPFHYFALMESGVGTLGFKALNVPKWTKEGRELRANKEFMMDAAKSGLVVHEKVEKEAYKKGQDLLNKAINLIPEKIGDKDITPGINKFRKGLNYLFEEFHPNLKVTTWKALSDKEIGRLVKDGIPPSETQRTKIKKDIATLVNDTYGGQNWEKMRFLNNPETMKWLRRTVGYPDWTTSAIRQAANVMSPGVKGKVSRAYWLKYMTAFLATQGLLKFMSSGWKQTDPDKSIKGLRWSLDKATDGLANADPSKWYMFPLPDAQVKIGNSIVNPGRDWQDKKLYGHFGKQMLEIGNWIKHPFNTYFSKSNPLIQLAFKQVMGETPFGEDWFKARGKYKAGKMEAWDATKPWTTGRLASRGKEVVGDVLPFGFKTLTEKGLAPFLASGMGAIPLSKGMSIYKAKPLLQKALEDKDIKMVNRIAKALRDNKYSEKSIKSAITSSKNVVKKTQ